MAEGLTGTEDYLEGWAWSDAVERAGTAEDVAEAVAAEEAAAWRDAAQGS